MEFGINVSMTTWTTSVSSWQITDGFVDEKYTVLPISKVPPHCAYFLNLQYDVDEDEIAAFFEDWIRMDT